MDDFLIGPQSDEYTWWDYEMEFEDDSEQGNLSNNCQPHSCDSGEGKRSSPKSEQLLNESAGHRGRSGGKCW